MTKVELDNKQLSKAEKKARARAQKPDISGANIQFVKAWETHPNPAKPKRTARLKAKYRVGRFQLRPIMLTVDVGRA